MPTSSANMGAYSGSETAASSRLHWLPRSRNSTTNRTRLPALAASYLFALARNQGCVDGNKRVAFMAMYVFLLINKLELDVDEAQAVGVVVGVADGSISESQLAAWTRSHQAVANAAAAQKEREQARTVTPAGLTLVGPSVRRGRPPRAEPFVLHERKNLYCAVRRVRIGVCRGFGGCRTRALETWLDSRTRTAPTTRHRRWRSHVHEVRDLTND